jgi:hypothetical protein
MNSSVRLSLNGAIVQRLGCPGCQIGMCSDEVLRQFLRQRLCGQLAIGTRLTDLPEELMGKCARGRGRGSGTAAGFQ